MKEQNEKLRTTIYIDEQLVKRAEILFGEAEVNSFSAFASKAIENYITKLVIDKNGDLLSNEIKKAIKKELDPINSRISKAMYRYAVIIQSLMQVVGWRCKITNDALERIHKDANRRVAQSKGYVNLDSIVSKNYYDEDGDDTEEAYYYDE